MYLAALDLCCCAEAPSSCGVQASRAPGRVASVVAAQEPRCPVRVGSSQTRDRTCVPFTGRQLLNHETTRGAQVSIF